MLSPILKCSSLLRGQLKEMTREKQYREAANLLEAVGQLLTHFELYAEVPKIKDLTSTVQEVA